MSVGETRGEGGPREIILAKLKKFLFIQCNDISQQLMGTSFSSSGQSSVPGQCFTINGISFPFIDGLLSHSGVGGAFGFGAQLRVAVVHEMMDGPVLSYQSINVAIYYWDIVKQLDLLNYRSISTTAVLACPCMTMSSACIPVCARDVNICLKAQYTSQGFEIT